MRFDYELPYQHQTTVNTDMFELAMRRKMQRERDAEYERLLVRTKRMKDMLAVLLMICIALLIVMFANVML